MSLRPLQGRGVGGKEPGWWWSVMKASLGRRFYLILAPASCVHHADSSQDTFLLPCLPHRDGWRQILPPLNCQILCHGNGKVTTDQPSWESSSWDPNSFFLKAGNLALLEQLFSAQVFNRQRSLEPPEGNSHLSLRPWKRSPLSSFRAEDWIWSLMPNREAAYTVLI